MVADIGADEKVYVYDKSLTIPRYFVDIGKPHITSRSCPDLVVWKCFSSSSLGRSRQADCVRTVIDAFDSVKRFTQYRTVSHTYSQ